MNCGEIVEIPLYRIFYIHKGKYFVSKVNGISVSVAITKKHPTFKEDCLWFTFEKCIKIIKHNRSLLTTWGIVDKNGIQYTVGKFDGILKRD
jgi:hypothetical protein